MKIKGFLFVPIPAPKGTKNHNIKLMLNGVVDKSIGIAKDAWGNFMMEVFKWNPAVSKNEDTVLDLAKMMAKCVELYKSQMLEPLYGGQVLAAPSPEVLSEYENSPF